MRKTNEKAKLGIVLLAIVLSLLLSYACKNAFGNVYDLINLNSNFSCETPTVILVNGANQTSTIYENRTSARVTINGTSSPLTYNYSLNIVNDDLDPWEARLECFEAINASRLSTTIVLHDNFTSSTQLSLNNMGLNQSEGYYYSLAGNSTIHVGVMDLVENSSDGTTILQVYLRMRIPGTTTDTLYAITFEFT
jgi:hypothetical protein